MAKALIEDVAGMPELTAVQLVAPLALLKTPPPWVPAYSVAGVEGSMARATTFLA
jgi:hypothetical protein